MQEHALHLHFSNRQQPDHPLAAGVLRLVRQANGTLGLGEAAGALLAQFCLDRRGLWLQVANGARGIHVNGRPVRRMALLRAGDAVYADGVELLVRAGPRAPEAAQEPAEAAAHEACVVLRGVGGAHHGRCFTLAQPRLVGSVHEADIRIDDPAFAPRHAMLERQGGQVLLRDLGSAEGSVVNGMPVRDAVLAAGDQVVFEGQHRFVVEAPALPDLAPRGAGDTAEPAAAPAAPPRSGVRVPWLLLAAILLAGALSALLWFGSP
ncbi:FHA domain-containing protein [Pseudoxanthomonas sp. SGNA-20]|uniref:FHA domain-containing protein n=1 Tax=unclassified Pseudoxanthomonas TaxID=2645906 RepID=UPI0002EC17CF|nr:MULTISPECIES: FHA domain-containing protein [unclassified Pseudoxanthomonas]RRN57230.1 FHA domain-containing protein [Pseudoxanthomonas sp. SGNA-20]